MATAREDHLICIPEESRPGKQVVSKDASAIPIAQGPAVKTYFMQVPEASLTDPTGDFVRLGQALEERYALAGLSNGFAGSKIRTEADRVARRVDYVEMTLMDDFQENLIDATHIPNMTDEFPHLKK